MMFLMLILMCPVAHATSHSFSGRQQTLSHMQKTIPQIHRSSVLTLPWHSQSRSNATFGKWTHLRNGSYLPRQPTYRPPSHSGQYMQRNPWHHCLSCLCCPGFARILGQRSHSWHVLTRQAMTRSSPQCMLCWQPRQFAPDVDAFMKFGRGLIAHRAAVACAQYYIGTFGTSACDSGSGGPGHF